MKAWRKGATRILAWKKQNSMNLIVPFIKPTVAFWLQIFCNVHTAGLCASCLWEGWHVRVVQLTANHIRLREGLSFPPLSICDSSSFYLVRCVFIPPWDCLLFITIQISAQALPPWRTLSTDPGLPHPTYLPTSHPGTLICWLQSTVP